MTLERARVPLAGGLALVLALALGAEGWILAEHEAARRAWAAESARVGDAGYSSARSDALYREVDARRARARTAAWALALALALFGAAAGAARGPRTVERRAATVRVLALTTALDALAAAALFGTTVVAARVRTGSPALDDACALVLPALVLGPVLAITARGETPGSLATRLAHAPWPPSLAPLAALALTLAFLAPLGALAALARPAARTRLLAPQLWALGALRE